MMQLSMQATSLPVNSTQQAGRAAAKTKGWAVKNPWKAAGVVAAPAAGVVAAPYALVAAGFEAGGVAAGKCTDWYFPWLVSSRKETAFEIGLT